MSVITISLLIANIATTVGIGVYVSREIDKLRKQEEKTEAVVYAHISKVGESVGYDMADMEKELKQELKDHISKEFMAMTFRGIKVVK